MKHFYSKLLIIFLVMLTFTILNVIKGSNWWGYVISLLILPFITWLVIEIFFFLKGKK